MDQLEVEQLVCDLYRGRRLDPKQPESPWKLARLELGEDCFVELDPRFGSYTFLWHDDWKIALDPRLRPAEAAHACAHELGHAVFGKLGIRFATRALEEDAANRFGGAVLAPTPAMAAFRQANGVAVAKLAKTAGASNTWAALRYGEALGEPVAVLSRSGMRTRGAEFDWPEAERLRRLAWSERFGCRKHLNRAGAVAFFPNVSAA